MKKYVSIFEWLSRNTIYKILLIVIAMGITQAVMFGQAMSEMIPVETHYIDSKAVEYYGRAYDGLEWLIDRSNGAGFFGLAFVLITAVLCWNGCNIGSKSSYTIQRLQVSEKAVFVMQSIYNSFCYVLLLSIQTAVFLIECKMFAEQAGDITNQTIFLAFYRNDFMHSVLPLEDSFRWVMNGILVIGCGVSAAVFTYLQRRGKLAWSMLTVTACAVLGFIQELGNQMVMVTAILILITAGITAYCHIFQKKEGE